MRAGIIVFGSAVVVLFLALLGSEILREYDRALERAAATSENLAAVLEHHTTQTTEIIDGSRRKRIARGSGTAVEEVNRLLKQFGEMQRMLKMVGQMTGEPIPAPPRKKKKSPFSLMK